MNTTFKITAETKTLTVTAGTSITNYTYVVSTWNKAGKSRLYVNLTSKSGHTYAMFKDLTTGTWAMDSKLKNPVWSEIVQVLTADIAPATPVAKKLDWVTLTAEQAADLRAGDPWLLKKLEQDYNDL